jgi:hypothetical protein
MSARKQEREKVAELSHALAENADSWAVRHVCGDASLLHLCTTLERERKKEMSSLSPPPLCLAAPPERSLKFVRYCETAPGGRGLPALVNAAGVLR